MKKYSLQAKSKKEKINEPEVVYQKRIAASVSSKHIGLKDFQYSDFKKIADKAPFTLANWAEILHISERTLHRYANENAVFNGLQTERILLTEKLIDLGNQLFDKAGFKKWLQFKPYSLQFQTPLSLLHTYQGIQEVTQLLGKMQHGIPA